METNNILQSDILDIIFDGKNKQYGAYQIRKTYNRRLYTSLLIMSLFCMFIFLSAFFVSKKEKVKFQQAVISDITIANVKSIQPRITAMPLIRKKHLQNINLTKYTPPQMVADNEVKSLPPDNLSLDNTQIGTVDNNGGEESIPTPASARTGISELPVKQVDVDTIYHNVEIEAKFKGDWMKYLQRNLHAEIPAENNAPSGNYSVIVSFIVDRQGNISEVKALNNPGYGTAGEAIRVITKTPEASWSAAIQNGRTVVYRQKQIITFQVQEE